MDPKGSSAVAQQCDGGRGARGGCGTRPASPHCCARIYIRTAVAVLSGTPEYI